MATKPLALGTLSGSLSADPALPGDEPLAMTADHVEVDLQSQLLEPRGGVRVSRGEKWISAERASTTW